MLRVGTFVGDRYEILGKIGSGGMSDVYKAKCHKLNRQVAIKVLKKEFCSNHTFVTRFKVEAQAAAKLTHPNIVAIYDVGDEGDLHYIVMELVEGITLKDYISRKGRLENRETIGIAIQVAQGLEAAHAQNIVHRDIKPQNIIISREGKVKVMDFGIAKAVTGDTINSEAIGSVHYISPEQARGGYCDARSDVYSLGITLYEMLTGVVPYDGENTVSVALAHIQGEMIPPRQLVDSIPPSLEKIIQKCTQKTSEYRYNTITALITDLRKAYVMPEGDFVVLPADTVTAASGGDHLHTVRAEEDSDAGGIAESLDSEAELDSLYHEMEDMDYTDSDENEEDEDEENDYGAGAFEEEKASVGDRIAFAISIVLAIIILLMAFYLIGRLTGLIKGNTQNPTETSSEETETETPDNSQTKMPDLTGMTEEEAEEALNEAGLGMTVEYETSERVEEGYVISQEFGEGKVLDRNIKVVVIISSGSNRIEIPATILGKTRSEAEVLLADLNLDAEGVVVTYTNQYSQTYEVGLICGMLPASGQVKKGGNLILYVSQGEAPVTIKMPNVVEKDAEQAKYELEALGLVVELVEKSHKEIEEGYVISQSIAVNTQVKEGTSVTLTVSTGTGIIEVPNVVGLSQSDAEADLTELGIKYEIITVEVSDARDVGRVQSQSISYGTDYKDDEVMKIEVGVEKGSVTLPSTFKPGISENEAKLILQSLNMELTPHITTVPDATIPAGFVVSMEKKAGDTVNRGDVIAITISSGPAPTDESNPTDSPVDAQQDSRSSAVTH